MERNAIAGIAADRNEARITLTGIADQPGTVAAVMAPLAAAGIQVDLIVHAATEGAGASDLTFTVPRASLAQARAAIELGSHHATHLFNRMSSITSRSPGVVGAVLESDAVAAEIIPVHYPRRTDLILSP